MTFDPYAEIFGIQPHERPVDFYRLLGVTRLEADRDTIARAADQRTASLHGARTPTNSPQIEHVLNEIGEARRWLLTPAQKVIYDTQLQTMIGGQEIAHAQPLPKSPEVPLASPTSFFEPPSVKTDNANAAGAPLPSPPVPGGMFTGGEQPLASPSPIRDVPTPSSGALGTGGSEFPLTSPGLPGHMASSGDADQPIAVPRSGPPGHVPSLQEIATRSSSNAGSTASQPVGGTSQPIHSPPSPGIKPPGPAPGPMAVPTSDPGAAAPLPMTGPPEPSPPEAAPPMQGFNVGGPPILADSPPAPAPPAEASSSGPAIVSRARSRYARPMGFPMWVPVAGLICLMLIMGALLGIGLTWAGPDDPPKRRDTATTTNPAAPNGGDQAKESKTDAEKRRDRVRKQLAEQARQAERDRLQRTEDGRIIDPAIGIIKAPPPKDGDDPLDTAIGGTINDPAQEIQLVRVARPADTALATTRVKLTDMLAAADPKDLLTDAFKDTHPADERYVMLNTARQGAARRGQVDVALQAVDAMHRQFEIDPVEMKIDTLRGMRQTAATPGAYGAVVDGAMQVAEDVEKVGDQDALRSSLTEALIAARKSGDPELVRKVTLKLIGIDLPSPQTPDESKPATDSPPMEKPDITVKNAPPATPADPAADAPQP